MGADEISTEVQRREGFLSERSEHWVWLNYESYIHVPYVIGYAKATAPASVVFKTIVFTVVSEHHWTAECYKQNIRD